jgi:hypothetical protein
MSFDQLSALESQPTTTRSSDAYADDPEFQRLSQELMTKLFTLTGNISRLSNQIAQLGGKRDTERLRERVHDLLEETKESFKDIGEGVKKIQTWEDVSVGLKRLLEGYLTNNLTAVAKVHTTETLPGVPGFTARIPKCPTPSP